MKLKSTLLAALVFLCGCVFATPGLTINPTVTASSFCAGDSMTIIIATTDTFPAGNIFTIKLRNGLTDPSPVTIGHVTGQGNDTLKIAAPNVNGSNFYIAAISSSDSLGLTVSPISINARPIVHFRLPQSTFCTFASAFLLSGTSPAGGVFSGNYVQDSLFNITQSGAGTFKVFYTYSANAGCSATDSQTVTVNTCPSPSVSVQVSPATLCPGGVMNINIQTSDILAYDNVFSVQLSDSSGSFATPTILASDTNTTNNIIQIATPVVPAGTHYKVRVIASNPSTGSVPFNVTFRARLAAPNISLDTTGSLSLCARDSFKLKIDSLRGISYQWTRNGVALNVPKYSYTAKDSGIYIVTFTDTTTAGCSSGADTVVVGVYAYPAKPVISPAGTTAHCGPGTVNLSTPVNNAVTFQWANHGRNIAGATSNAYAADTTGVYLVRATNSHGCTTKSDSVHVNIHGNPTVTFSIAQDSFCLHSAILSLSGGSPAGNGGFYSGNYIINNSTFDQTASGVGSFEIYYTFIDTIGCRGTDSTKINIYDCTTLGIEELSAQHAFQMFPNPATDQVHISTLASGNCKMRLFNLLGQEVGAQLFNQQLTYSFDQLPAGVYMVEVSDIANSWKTVKRLTIQ